MIAAFAEKEVGASVVLAPRIASSEVANSTKPETVVEAAGVAAVTKAVVASAVVLLPGDWVVAIVPVGSVGVPVKVGLARLALRLSAVVTKAVVASCVVLVAAEAVGAVGVPVNAGEARGALRSRLPWRSTCAERVPVIAPHAVEVTGVTPPTLTVQAA
jgi:hypothetical protein